MKITNLMLMASLWVGMWFTTAASAHEYLGTLGAAATATDIWYFTCSNPNTAKVWLQVARPSGTKCIKSSFAGTTWNVTSCSSVLSPQVGVSTGPGSKIITVSKNPAATGIVSYRVRANCVDNTGYQNPADQSDLQWYLQNQ